MAEEIKNTQTAAQPQQQAQPQLQPQSQPQAKTPTIEELQAEIKHLKDAISVSNGDAAKKKREAEEWQGKYKATLDEQKRKEFEAEEALKQLKAENAEFKQRERIANYTTKLVAAGYDPATASIMAAGLPEGIKDEFFDSQKAFLENKTKEIRTQTINSQPGLPVGAPLSSADAAASQMAADRKLFGL